MRTWHYLDNTDYTPDYTLTVKLQDKHELENDTQILLSFLVIWAHFVCSGRL